MMEWYEAYASMQDQMDLTKAIILNAASSAGCEESIEWDENKINLGNFKQSTLSELVVEYNPKLKDKDLSDKKILEQYLKSISVKIDKTWGPGRLLLEIFEETVESKLIDPTFVTEYPVEVSPLSRK